MHWGYCSATADMPAHRHAMQTPGIVPLGSEFGDGVDPVLGVACANQFNIVIQSATTRKEPQLLV
jgi:hypothetical protein